MPVIRNPFRKNAPPLLHTTSDTTVQRRRTSSDSGSFTDHSPTTAASKSTSAISISNPDDECNSYKMSVVNDSGVYLPPSPPPEKKGFWKRPESSHNRPPVSPSSEPFTISRESFDSYRRSFDISARSPVSEHQSPRPSMERPPPSSRQSLDVRPTSRMSSEFLPAPRMSLDSRRSARTPDAVVEESAEHEFEDVKLTDDKPPVRGGRFNIFHRGTDASHASKPSSGVRFFGASTGLRKDPHESELKYIQREGKQHQQAAREQVTEA